MQLHVCTMVYIHVCVTLDKHCFRGGCGVFAANDWILESQLYKCVRETASWVLENILSQIQRRISFFDLVCVDFKLFARITQTVKDFLNSIFIISKLKKPC